MAKAIILIFERVGKDLVCTTRKKKKKKHLPKPDLQASWFVCTL